MEKTNKLRFINAIVSAMLFLAARGGAIEFPGPAPGDAQGRVSKGGLVVENKLLSCAWDVSEGRVKPGYVRNKLGGSNLQSEGAECFLFILKGGQVIRASDMKIVGGPDLKNLDANKKSCRLAERFGGKQITIKLASSDNDFSVEWRAILRDGSNYVRQEVMLTAGSKPVEVEETVLLEYGEPNAKVMGVVDGSPVAIGDMFFAQEHPLSRSQVLQGNSKGFRCSLTLGVRLNPGESIVQSSVIGVVPQGQLRRGFLYYLERERVQPYRQFLHYNSWYDIGFGVEKIQDSKLLDVIERFGNELVKQRKISLDSFVLDDGWDDPASLWQFHKELPNGFASMRQMAEKYDSALGAWLSPFGGYGKAKEERLKYGRQQGFETNKSGFALAGPAYYARFRDVCIKMLREYGLNYFKFDGIGSTPTGAGEFAQDMDAMLRLIGDLRRVRPDVFVNITTGTWPSPYWLWYGDSIWRGGADWSTCGWGSKRQQQITYRDKETYNNIVKRAPLYPLNSLMSQGIMLANHGLANETNDLSADIREFFGSGTDCQELYITPSMMRPQDWDALAQSAKWSRDNADVLVDTHWVGGDPRKGEIYGWASWTKRKGILSLRNPRDKGGTISVDIGRALELPKGAATKYVLKNAWKKDADKPVIMLSAGKDHIFELEPFEVVVFDAMPGR